MNNIRKILVANRGEIALRIMRTAREMGIETVAVYSEADRKSPHVRFADEAVLIGPSPSSKSYLNGNKIINCALILKADAIHPGYGFLSENAEFAKMVEEAGLKFIGPSPKSIQIMGDKLSAKKAVSQYNIPMIPGTDKAITDIQEAKTIAKKIGYPILIKASAGGGGKGMRVVEKEKDLEPQLQRAISEAKSAFGDPAVFLEKYINSPRHIEIQVLGDFQGNMVYLFERECSIQRRHQKVIEEAPSAVVSEGMRRNMGNAAIKVAKACQYYGAGTVEFIVDEALNFYFLEMNTRLQVEHPVTEMITGKDLVKEQILIAEGELLDFGQEDLKINGHAIEVRVYAEDPKNNFLPDIGRLRTYKRPQGPGVRVDDGYEEGLEIPIHYDPMIAKLVVYDQNREKAIQRMIRAIEEYQISGLETTLPFAHFVMQHPYFQNGNFDTRFIEKYFKPSELKPKLDDTEKEVLAALGIFFYQKHHSSNKSGVSQENNVSPWKKRLKDG